MFVAKGLPAFRFGEMQVMFGLRSNMPLRKRGE
jgi:hypothetical protein